MLPEISPDRQGIFTAMMCTQKRPFTLLLGHELSNHCLQTRHSLLAE